MSRTHIAPRHAFAALLGVVLATLPLAPAAAAPMVTCAERSSSSQCDADTDRIVDVVEQQVCGTATTANSDILLATPPWEAPPGSYFAAEVDYLRSQGFMSSITGTEMYRAW